MIKKLLLLVSAAIIFFSGSSVVDVAAQSFDQQFYSSNNVLFFNPDEAACTTAGVGAQSGDATSTAFTFLKEKRLDDREVSAIIGNLRQESNLNPKALNESSGAYGIAQWADGRKDQLLQNSFYSGDFVDDAKIELDIQLEFLWSELQGSEKASLDALQDATTTDVGELAVIFGEAFARYGEGEEGKRAQYAESILGQYAGAGGASNDCRAAGAGNFVYYSQKDPLWGSKPYGTIGTINDVGCGPTSVAMIVATFANKSVTPDVVAQLGAANGSAIQGVGTAHTPLLNAMRDTYGLEFSDLTGQPIEAAIEAVRRGSLVYMGGQGPAPFTGGGHIVVMRGITPDGQIVIGDPYRGASDVYSVETIKTYRGSTFEIKPRSASVAPNPI